MANQLPLMQLRTHIRATSVLVVFIFLSFMQTSLVQAQISVPAIFSDNMVLQRSSATPIWGRSAPAHKVVVRFEKVVAETTADAQGKWRVNLDLTGVSSSPGDLVIEADEKRTIHNVITGEVWLCSGQSNMEMTADGSLNASAEAASADYPEIRHFTVSHEIANVPVGDVNGKWVVCTPETVMDFSAVAYFFGRDIYLKIHQPIGLINSSFGGTDAEAWTSDQALLSDDRYRQAIELRKLAFQDADAAHAKFDAETIEWMRDNLPPYSVDDGVKKRLADPAKDVTSWKTMELPQTWQSAGLKHNGVVWFRKDFELPAQWKGKPAVLELGRIDDVDFTFVNGVPVGQTYHWSLPRKYPLESGVLKPGKNTIAVCVDDQGGLGGLVGPAVDMRLTCDGQNPIPLAGSWHYQVELQYSIDFAALPPRPVPPMAGNPNQPAVLYNGMIAPLIPYAIRGAIWYQGENNVGRGHYSDLLQRMVAGWRKDWATQFPFYIVQLANFMAPDTQPTDSKWARLRAEQADAAAAIPHSGLAVAIDIGDANDIHPRNKQEVGRRLALIALAKDYGQAIEYSGPVYQSCVADGDSIRVTFSHAEGLHFQGAALEGFAIAAADGKFAWAEATIDGASVILRSPSVTSPTKVRYGWSDNPGCNLYNSANLPAVPFETR
ncbi:MAG: beta galactosidase jelly roll domain-containing protein [Phycisphaerales bacterium]|nr:beta galactosidase jelly roll domain-containing protein [Phycisphaerales bacterium]